MMGVACRAGNAYTFRATDFSSGVYRDLKQKQNKYTKENVLFSKIIVFFL